MKFSNKVFDVLKWIALILLPAFSAFYMAMAKTWNLPFSAEVVATIAAVDALLGIVLGLATTKYNASLPNSILATSDAATKNFLGANIPTEIYDFLFWLAQVGIPSLAATYLLIAPLWGFPLPEQVAATLMAFDAFLGLLLGFSTEQFKARAYYASK